MMKLLVLVSCWAGSAVAQPSGSGSGSGSGLFTPVPEPAPEPTVTASDSTSAGADALPEMNATQTAKAKTFTLKITGDFAAVTATDASKIDFKDRFKTDLAVILSVPADQIRVTNLAMGSIVVTTVVLPDAAGNAPAVTTANFVGTLSFPALSAGSFGVPASTTVEVSAIVSGVEVPTTVTTGKISSAGAVTASLALIAASTAAFC